MGSKKWKCYFIVLYSQILTFLLYHLVTGENRENTGTSFEAIVYNGSYSNYNSLLLKAERPTIEVNNL